MFVKKSQYKLLFVVMNYCSIRLVWFVLVKNCFVIISWFTLLAKKSYLLDHFIRCDCTVVINELQINCSTRIEERNVGTLNVHRNK